MSPASPTLLPEGTRIAGRYRVQEHLGHGHPGEVYLAEQETLGRQVAVKVLERDADEPQAESRFEREAAALARLSHPACAEVLDYGLWEGRMFLALRYVPGPSLADTRGTRWDALEALTLMIDLASGLAHAHDRGVVHRNLAPERIVLVTGRRERRAARMVDFGLARLKQPDLDTTAGRQPIGTPGYMAPERVRGDPGDARVDVYAVGILLFELLTGAHPFARETANATFEAQTREAVPRLDAVDPPVATTPALTRVVERATAWNPAARFADGRELARALKAARLTLADPSLAALDLDVREGRSVLPEVLEGRLDDPTPTVAVRRTHVPDLAPPEPTPTWRLVGGGLLLAAILFVLGLGAILAGLWVAARLLGV